MPRIKGWKIFVDRKNRVIFENKTAKKYVIVHYNEWREWDDRWSVSTSPRNIVYFKTKAQALKFARDWMREHPNG